MARLATLTVPIEVALAAMGNAPRELRGDVQHVCKAAVLRAFGEGGLRPWRLSDQDEENFLIHGWLASDVGDREIREAKGRLDCEIRVEEYKPVDGAPVTLELIASPQRDVRIGPRDENGKSKTRSLDVADGEPSAAEAYARWIHRKLGPRSGIEVTDEIRIRSTRSVDGLYKSTDARHGYRVVRSRIPRVKATLNATVVNAGAFNEFLRRGLGPLIHVGYGSLIPAGLGYGF